MIDCYLIDVNTGKIQKYYSRYWKLDEVIGKTFTIQNKFYVCTTAIEGPDQGFTNPDIATMLSANDERSYQTIGVSFPNGFKTYHYFISKKDCFGLGKDSRLYIKTPYNNEQLVEIVEPYIAPKDSHATKAIEIVRKVDPTRQPTKKVATVRYISGKSISNSYKYEIKTNTVLFTNQLYWLEENKSLVIVDNIEDAPFPVTFLREKIFTIPTFDQIKNSFKETENLNVLHILKKIDTDNLNCYCKNYIEQIASGKKSTQYVYPLNSTSQAAQRATISYSDFATSISNYTNQTVCSSDTVFNKMNNKGEDKMNMNKMFKNFEFGKINTDAIKFSINGLAFKQEDGSYATYDAEKHEFTDVSAFVMDTDFIFAMPVALKDLKAGDIVKHLNRYVIIAGIFEEDGTIKAIDPLAGEEKVIIPIKNMFGFNYYTKIVNVFDGMGMKPDAENPFGNILPLLFMRDGGFDDTMMLAMMMQNSGNSANFMSNPLMMMALMKK